jgi:hypothetical protein
MFRTADGWRIERIIQRRSWEYGNTSAVAEATARSQADRRGRDPAAALGVRFMSDDPYSASGPSYQPHAERESPQLKPEHNCQLRAPTNSEKPRSRPGQIGSARFPIGGLSALGDRLADDRSSQRERARSWLARRAGI